jgi:hypothetical protein
MQFKKVQSLEELNEKMEKETENLTRINEQIKHSSSVEEKAELKKEKHDAESHIAFINHMKNKLYE